MIYKSMTTFADHRVWQDVYHVPAFEMTMVATENDLPDTMVPPETGKTLFREVRPFVVAYKGRSVTVDLPGYCPENGNEGIHVGDDMAVTDAALRSLR